MGHSPAGRRGRFSEAGLYHLVRTLGTRTGDPGALAIGKADAFAELDAGLDIRGAGVSPATSGRVFRENQEYNSIITGGSHMKKGIRKLKLCMEALRDSEAAKVVAGDEPSLPKPLDPPTPH